MHGVEPAVDQRIRKIARDEKTSINRAAQALLRRALGLDASGGDHRSDFLDLTSRWTKDDLAEFDAATAAFSKIDAEDWK
jgi:hypothetical protein